MTTCAWTRVKPENKNFQIFRKRQSRDSLVESLRVVVGDLPPPWPQTPHTLGPPTLSLDPPTLTLHCHVMVWCRSAFTLSQRVLVLSKWNGRIWSRYKGRFLVAPCCSQGATLQVTLQCRPSSYLAMAGPLPPPLPLTCSPPHTHKISRHLRQF